ncbi:MAG: TIM barrel protein [Candidatus Sericytochromatia bacterium]|nr:TIM barrel protein [Candidatus Sericytochromatia bacterium]
MSPLRVAEWLAPEAVAPAAWGGALAAAAAAGFEGVALPGGVDLVALPPAPLAPGLRPVLASLSPGLTDGQAVALALNQINPLLDALAAAGCETVVVSEPGVPGRLRVAGRVHEAGARGLRDEEWHNLAGALDELGGRCRARGLALAFAPRAGSWVETPVELKRLLNSTDAELVGLSLDTGHVAYGGGNAAAAVETWRWRLRHVHLQAVDTAVLDTALRHGLGLDEALRRGVFRLPEAHHHPLQAVLEALLEGDLAGWLTLGPGPAEASRTALAAVWSWLGRGSRQG